ncbi:MAG: hypothetical protein IIZ99_05765, partial [Turicibacter sp.]|nr:hypothetical protein [Turicibacter sp.]
NGENILIELNEECKCQSIGATKLVIKKAKRLKRYNIEELPRLIANEIEGDDLELMLTEAKVVRGDCVKIGPGSIIDVLEYSSVVEIDKTAKVLQQVRN